MVTLFALPAEDDGLIGSFSSVMYPGGGVSVIGKVALSGTADANSSRLGSSGCSIGICNREHKELRIKYVSFRVSKEDVYPGIKPTCIY